MTPETKSPCRSAPTCYAASPESGTCSHTRWPGATVERAYVYQDGRHLLCLERQVAPIPEPDFMGLVVILVLGVMKGLKIFREAPKRQS